VLGLYLDGQRQPDWDLKALQDLLQVSVNQVLLSPRPIEKTIMAALKYSRDKAAAVMANLSRYNNI
jgi:hypothetical protein